MANYAAMNPGKYHLGQLFRYPPLQNRRLNERYIIQEVKWKTSAMVGRRIYIGNVEIKDKDGKLRTMSDTVLKSRAGKFDTFTTDRLIDVAVGDGEDIIRLASFADRLLQYKQNTMYIINCTKSLEILESKHKFKGVDHHNAVCETDYGIVWCNEHGVYMYNGRLVNELFITEGVRNVSEETWDSFYSKGKTSVGYLPDSKQVIFVRGVDSSDTDSGDILIYDLVSASWVKGDSQINAEDKTNLINDWNNDLIYGYESDVAKTTLQKYSVTPTSSIATMDMKTKFFNFGNQSRKKIYKVEITYKGGVINDIDYETTNVLPQYAVDSSNSYSGVFRDADGNAITNIPSSSDWSVIELYTSPIDNNNVKSISIQLTEASAGAVRQNFEVNDITIVYRQKSVK